MGDGPAISLGIKLGGALKNIERGSLSAMSSASAHYQTMNSASLFAFARAARRYFKFAYL